MNVGEPLVRSRTRKQPTMDPDEAGDHLFCNNPADVPRRTDARAADPSEGSLDPDRASAAGESDTNMTSVSTVPTLVLRPPNNPPLGGRGARGTGYGGVLINDLAASAKIASDSRDGGPCGSVATPPTTTDEPLRATSSAPLVLDPKNHPYPPHTRRGSGNSLSSDDGSADPGADS